MSKLINVKNHSLRDILKNKSLELTKIHTEKNIINTLTKILTKGKYVYCRDGAGMEGH